MEIIHNSQAEPTSITHSEVKNFWRLNCGSLARCFSVFSRLHMMASRRRIFCWLAMSRRE
jgi:hypothetical protein